MYIQLKTQVLQHWVSTFINYFDADNLFEAFAIMRRLFQCRIFPL